MRFVVLCCCLGGWIFTRREKQKGSSLGGTFFPFGVEEQCTRVMIHIWSTGSDSSTIPTEEMDLPFRDVRYDRNVYSHLLFGMEKYVENFSTLDKKNHK